MNIRPIRVLHSSPRTPSTNPYILQLFEALSAQGVDVLPWSFRNALLRRYDLVHVHWPEGMYRKRTRLRAIVAAALFGLVLTRWAIFRPPLIRTVHNRRPHIEPRGLERFANSMVDRLTIKFIDLHSAPSSTTERLVIPHGHYRDWYPSAPAHDPEAGRFLVIGTLERYKDIVGLVERFSTVRSGEERIVIRGGCADSAYRRELAALIDTPALDLRIGFVDDETIAIEAGRATATLLLYPEMGNSGAVLLSLSLGCPVIATRSAMNEELLAEVGTHWMRLVDDPRDPVALRSALDWSRRTRPKGLPDLERRDWAGIALMHRKLYDEAVESPGLRTVPQADITTTERGRSV